MTRRPRLVLLVGPTASGKSAIALELARRLHGEILSVDAMQVYQGMDLGTGKPSAAERAAVPHHGLDLVAPQVEFTVAMYRRYAVTTLAAIAARGRVPIMAGGTGLYVRAVVDGLCPAPPADEAYRAQLAQEVAAVGPAGLYASLRQVDPPAAGRIHPHDARRIIRALEVHHTTGRPLSAWQAATTGLGEHWEIRGVGVTRPRPILAARIAARLRGMVAAGLVEEARGIFARGVGRTAAQAIGYKELFAAFAGRWSVEEAMRRIQQETCRYAKRQLTWFRRESLLTWVTLGADDTPAQAATQMLPLVAD